MRPCHPHPRAVCGTILGMDEEWTVQAAADELQVHWSGREPDEDEDVEDPWA